MQMTVQGDSMVGKWVTINAPSGTSFKAWMTAPSSRPAPTILLLQEIFGVNAHIRELAEQFAERGYIVIAPDLFWRLTPGLDLSYSENEIAVALDHYKRFDVGAAMSDINAVISFLRLRSECTGKIAALGYCLGGYLAFRCATECDVDGAVAYYGVGIENHLSEDVMLRCPIMIHYADKDKFITSETVQTISDYFAENAFVEIFRYQDVDHGFVNKEREAFNTDAATLSDARTFDFLDRILR